MIWVRTFFTHGNQQHSCHAGNVAAAEFTRTHTLPVLASSGPWDGCMRVCAAKCVLDQQQQLRVLQPPRHALRQPHHLPHKLGSRYEQMQGKNTLKQTASSCPTTRERLVRLEVVPLHRLQECISSGSWSAAMRVPASLQSSEKVSCVIKAQSRAAGQHHTMRMSHDQLQLTYDIMWGHVTRAHSKSAWQRPSPGRHRALPALFQAFPSLWKTDSN